MSDYSDLPHTEITGAIIGAGMRVHSALGPGFLESVYRNALVYELRSTGVEVEVEHRSRVVYRGQVVGEFIADLLVGRVVIVELKAVSTIAVAHEVQLVNYLTATGFDTGMLLNFGGTRLEFRRKARGLSTGGRRSMLVASPSDN